MILGVITSSSSECKVMQENFNSLKIETVCSVTPNIQEERRFINHYKNTWRGCGGECSLRRLSVSRRRNTKQPLWFDRPYMLMFGRPNSCVGLREAPSTPAPPPTQPASQPAPHPLWTCNNKALINKVYFPVRQHRPGPLFVPLPAR